MLIHLFGSIENFLSRLNRNPSTSSLLSILSSAVLCNRVTWLVSSEGDVGVPDADDSSSSAMAWKESRERM
jgi:hypothetical protein